MKKEKKVKCVNCGHELRYHAIPDKHNLGTSHCTKLGCECQRLELKPTSIPVAKELVL